MRLASRVKALGLRSFRWLYRRRFCLSMMNEMVEPMCPKFVPVEETDISSRYKRDGL